jgi:hypothetical protein
MSAEPDRVSGGTSSDVPYGTLILGGAGVGAVVFGVGSRVAMRLVGKVASPEHLGEQTAFGTVGRVTVNGVVELVVFGSIAGLLCGLIYLAFRSRLPGRWMARGLMFGLFLLVPFGFIITTSSRSDFDLASPTLILAIFAGMILIDGVATAWAIERLGRDSLPPPRPGALGYVILGAITSIGLVALGASVAEVF